VNLDVNHFFGTYEPRLDDKARLFLPAKFRPRLELGVALMPGQEKCIYGWTLEAYESIAERMREMPFTNREARKFQRLVSARTAVAVPDKQGRIPIPPVLRSWASLDREVTVIGAMDRIEIWDSGRWSEFLEANEEAYSDMSDEVMPGL
jgi:MraZ protein